MQQIWLMALLTLTSQFAPLDEIRVCGNQPMSVCVVGWLSVGAGWLHERLALPVLPSGAGTVMGAPAPNGCQITPSTGLGSGVNVRAEPSMSAPVVDDIPLDEYRIVSAISRDWYQTQTRDGRVGYVATNVSTLLGACGDVPRFVVTR